MLEFTDEVLARAFLLSCLGRGPISRSDILRHGLTRSSDVSGRILDYLRPRLGNVFAA